MIAGDVVLTKIQQADGKLKKRPAIVLRKMRPFGDPMVCAVSSVLRQEVDGFDEIIQPSDDDFKTAGLKVASLIRLGFVATLPPSAIICRMGSISTERLDRLKLKLSKEIQA